jgi:hypothetical protein
LPKKIVQKKEFHGGLVTAAGPSDIDETSLSTATNVMCDVIGTVRQMGKDSIHSVLDEALTANITPGYGLYAFNADHNVTDNSKIETKLLAVQEVNSIGIWDHTMNIREFNLGNDINDVQPVFYYVDGGLRVADGNLNNPENRLPRIYKYSDKTWFKGQVAEMKLPGDWQVGHGNSGLDSIIYPPTCLSSSVGALESNNNSATAAAPTGAGNLSFSLFYEDVNTGEWRKDGAMKFGVSYVYDGDQESPITDLLDTLDTSGLTNHDHNLKFQVKMKHGNTPDYFDPRLTSLKLHWIVTGKL